MTIDLTKGFNGKIRKKKKKNYRLTISELSVLIFQCFSRSVIEEAKEQYTRTHTW